VSAPVRLKPPLVMRELALAGLALLAGVVALAVVEQTRGGGEPAAQREGSYHAVAGSSGPAAFGRRTACGSILRPATMGVAHPTLPCGARVFITYNGKTVLTQVLDRGPHVPGRQFDLTDALARYLGLRGAKQISWSYARSG
jgi:Lytic transglycolase